MGKKPPLPVGGVVPNLEKPIRLFEVQVSTASSVYFICIGVVLNGVRPADKTEKVVDFGYVMDCLRLSVSEQYPEKVANIHLVEVRKTKSPVSHLAELHRAFDNAGPCLSKAEARLEERQISDKQQSPQNWGSLSLGENTRR